MRCQQRKQHWEETFWQFLARSFGTPLNADAFEAVAQTIPVTLLAKHKKQIHQVEAMLMGQAGLLNEKFTEDYPVMLQKEYRFLQKKYELKPVSHHLHFLRMRPSNFPTIRLAQLASLYYHQPFLFSKLIYSIETSSVLSFLQVEVSDYWKSHYTFDHETKLTKKKISNSFSQLLLVNVLVPIFYSYQNYSHP